MDNLKFSNLKNITIGLVYDVPGILDTSLSLNIPNDACAEWESQDTINLICASWQQLGCNVVLFPVDHNFYSSWEKNFRSCDFIHSLVEGFGSISREAWIPSLCEMSGVSFLGSSPFVHSVCMSKTLLKSMCQNLGIPTAQSFLIKNADDLKNIPSEFFKTKHFIKPDAEGSGMGVDAQHSISSCELNTHEITRELLKMYPDGIILETFLPGDEYTSGIIGLDKLICPIAHIEVPTGVYGVKNKSKDGFSEKITFPDLGESQKNFLDLNSKKLFDGLNMRDYARFDWKCDEYGRLYFLEANTLPGISPLYSALPVMAQQMEIDYLNFLNLLAQGPLSRKKDRGLYYGKVTMKNLNAFLSD